MFVYNPGKVSLIFKKAITIFSLVVVFVFALDATYVLKFPKRALPDQKADAIVVLGAAINSRAAYNRTIKGLRLYEAGLAEQLVLSGGGISSMDETEAEYMGRVVTSNAIESVDYILEQESDGTWENIYNTKALLPEADSILIISDTYHLPRAVLIAKKAGFKEVYWDSPGQYYYPPNELRWYYFREMAALLDYAPRLVF